MATHISPRLAHIAEALPLRGGMRVLEIGCGPGVLARAMVKRLGSGYVLGIDRSATAIRQAREGSKHELSSGILEFRQAAAEDFTLNANEKPYDMAVAIRVGALDGRHPEAGKIALHRIKNALKESGVLYIDGGNPITAVSLDSV